MEIWVSPLFPYILVLSFLTLFFLFFLQISHKEWRHFSLTFFFSVPSSSSLILKLHKLFVTAFHCWRQMVSLTSDEFILGFFSFLNEYIIICRGTKLERDRNFFCVLLFFFFFFLSKERVEVKWVTLLNYNPCKRMKSFKLIPFHYFSV